MHHLDRLAPQTPPLRRAGQHPAAFRHAVKVRPKPARAAKEPGLPQERAIALGGKPYTLLVKLISPDGQTIESGGGSSFTLRSKGR